jgi:DNA-directed RNA polymerase specialized sigma24 family protein
VVVHEIEGLGHATIASILKRLVQMVRSGLHDQREQFESFLQDFMK